MNPKIGLVVPGLTLGGGVPAVARFVAEAARQSGRWDVQLVSLCMASDDLESVSLRAPASWTRGVRVGRREWQGFQIPHVGVFLGELEFQRYRPRNALTKLLSDCDLIQVVSGSPAWANAVLGLGKPVALQVATRARTERRQRDAKPRRPSEWWRKAMTEITDRMDDRALRGVDAIQVENPWMLEYARRLNTGRDVDLRYAPPGVDADAFRPAEARDFECDPYILCVARLDDPRKNIGLLLEAYALLPVELRNDVRLVLAGSSGPLDEFWRRATELGLRKRICYIERPDSDALLSLYQGAIVFAFPSDEEGLGVVALEAMACGVPVVSTRSGGPEGIITDGSDGFLVSLGDAVAMAARLAQLLKDPALNAAMGAKGRQTIERRYDERIAGEAFIDMWDQMMLKKKFQCAA